MKAIAVHPGKAGSVHLADVPKPSLGDVPGGRGVLVKVLQVGVDATDREINDALYGEAPPGDDFLVLGHECFGVVEAVGENVKSVKPGDYVTCTVRRPGGSIFDQIGTNDMTSEETYYERGISLRHGFLTEYFVDDVEFVVRVPDSLAHLGVLMEPASVVAKGLQQAIAAQQRLKVWRPARAFVMGAGQIGLLATLFLRLQNAEVYTIARSPGPHLKQEIAEAYGAKYISTEDISVVDLAEKVGRPDIIFEATGSSKLAFESMRVLAKNGALIWTSVTGGDNSYEFPTDRINLEWVLGNKLLLGTVNGNRWHFEEGLRELALGEMMYPGVTERILTSRVDGLENYAEMMRLLVEDKSALKVYVNVANE